MVPRLAFHEWEGFNAGESAQQMTAASRAWPGLTLLTLSDIKTAAWLVENNHLTQLERIIFTRDLDTQSVSTEVHTIKRLATIDSTKSDHQIFVPIIGTDKIKYASPVGVFEDRSFLMGVPDRYNEPTGSQGTFVVKVTPPRNASKPLQTL